MKKKILFVHHVSVVGGASYCLLSVIKELNREKFLPVVLLKDDGPLVEELKKLDIEILFCPTLTIYPYNKSLYRIRILISLYHLYQSIDDFEAVVRDCQPDIVYLNNTFLFSYLNVTKKLGIKSVIHIREHWPADEHQYQFRFVQKQILDKADRIVAINEYSARMISPDSSRVSVVYDWIDLDKRYKPLPLSEIIGENTSNLKVYIYTGGMQSIKGAYEVLKTFSEKISSDENRLLVLGFEKEIYNRNRIIKIIKDVLYLLGYPTYDCKVKKIAQKDSRIICIPSEYYIKDLFDQSYCMLSYFTMPHANLAMAEAMIEGLPVIAAKTEESLEYSDNGKLALLFDMNDISAFEKAISELDSNYSDLKHNLTLYNNKLRERFSRQGNSQRLMSVLDAL